ncbi:VOC family protein [Niabella beijingensis]|uniref:VOC family protein n=1 Tax=Niabella beijingensis TaxID=2872700 RepID=UPI001CBB8354|nr:VOC family protein [Niabella beijingensis]MBZ4191834.1 VOC family protein [Niabella beijingensis]
MHPKMIWANLPVDNLERTTKFYTDLGFKQNGTPNSQLTSFIIAENEFIIHFFLKEVLKSNMKIEIADAHAAAEIMFTLSAENKEEVDEWAAVVTKAGGKLLSQPETFGDSYYGFAFADPDGHRFNVFQM